MKTEIWIILLAALLLVCLVLTLWLFRPDQQATTIQIISDGEVLHTLPLAVDRTIQVGSEQGTNIITIQNGAVAVTEADCPDGHCMDRGFRSGGTQIVCLPNRLVIRFLGEQPVDGVVG